MTIQEKVGSIMHLTPSSEPPSSSQPITSTLASESMRRRLAAVWFADIAGYTRLSSKNENAAFELVDVFQGITRKQVEKYGGRLVKFLGDGAMAEFTSTDAAVRSALALRDEFGAESTTRGQTASVHVGVHVGEVATASDGDIYGDGVNVTSRLQEEAAPGQVLVSEEVWRHIRQQLEFGFQEAGERGLRGVRGRIRLLTVELNEEDRDTVAPRVQPKSIAVLPFDDISPEGDNEYFSDGMAEELINALTRVEGLRVASHTSSFAFKGKETNVRQIGEKLAVGTVLEGSVRKVGRRVRITPQLINAEDGYHLWSETFETDLEDVFSVQERISLAIVDALKVELADRESDPVVRQHTANLEAYNLYLKGRYYWNRHTREDLERSVECYEQAINCDPCYALAHSGLADTYHTLGALYLPPRLAYPKAKSAARRALDLDANLAEAHASLAEVQWRYDWQWDEAEKGFKRALELKPQYAQAHRMYANCLRDVGRIDEAIDSIRRAQELDPLSFHVSAAVAGIYYFARRYDEAIDECLRTLGEAPFFFPVRFFLGSCYERKQMYDEAIEQFQKVVELSGIPGAIVALGYVYAASGRQSEAQKILSEALKTSEETYVSAYGVASLYVAMNDLDNAFTWFEKAYEERSGWLASLKMEPRFDHLGSDPRFTALLGKVGLVSSEISVPGNLPVQPTPLIGRHKEIANVHDLLVDPEVRLLTLTGPGGTGKTRLGLGIAPQMLEEFPDGIFFVPLSSIRDPRLVITRTTRCLNLQVSGGRKPLDVLAEHLSGKRLLLVLDGFEHVLDAAREVSGLLQAVPTVKVMITSQAALRVRGEHEYAVPPLAVPRPQARFDPEIVLDSEAVELFRQRAKAVKPEFELTSGNSGPVVEICRRLDGLPLAIELAAARIKFMSPSMMLERLEDCLHLLTEGPRDVPKRQQTLRGAFDWSYNLLSEEEQALFRYLSVFVGGFSLEAAEWVCRPVRNELHVLDGLASLVGKSLLRQTETAENKPRFEMLETIRAYGQMLLKEAGENEAVRQRHSEYFLDLVERVEPQLVGSEEARWFDRLELEHGNVQAIINWALEQGKVEIAVRFGSALWWFWWVRGHFAEMRHRQEQALRRIAALPRALQAELLVGSGAMMSMDGDQEKAVELFEQAVALERDRKDKSGVPRALRSHGLGLSRLGEYARATALFKEALALDREIGNPRGECAALRALGKVEAYQGNYDRARDLVEEALELDRQGEDFHSTALSLSVLGDVAQYTGELDRSVQLYDEAIALYHELGSRPGVAYTMYELANVARKHGDLDKARRSYEKSLALLVELDNRRRIATVSALRPPVERGDFERQVELTRTTLGDEAYARAFQRGRALRTDEGIAFARQPSPS
jgi:predicted ATPase/TolB-like protein